MNAAITPIRRTATLVRNATAAWLAACLTLMAVCAAAQPGPSSRPALAAASGIKWANSRFVYKAEGKRLSEVLQDFSASQGLPAIIAEGVDGVVHGNFDTTPMQFLNAISKTYGIIWYHDGGALYFYPGRAVQSRLFRLKGFTRTQVEEMLSSLRLGDSRFPLRYNEAESTLLVYGPPRHVELVGAALESLDAGAAERNRTVVRVFPLSYASASDRRLGATVLPGIASTLRALYAGTPLSTDGVAQQQGRGAMAAKMQALRQNFGAGQLVPDLDPASGQQGASVPQAGRAAAPQARGVRSPVNFEDDQPSFEADEGTNAVIVHGRLNRMAEYAYLIKRLDLRPTLIELEAVIIDINSDSARRLGIDWSARGSRGQFSVSPSGVNLPDGSGSSLGGGFTVSTLWANAGRELLARIDAMQANGEARVVAKPKVLGVANRAAVMEEKRIAAVRVSGNLEANLFQIEAGTRLQVTPQVTEVNGATHMKLSLYIEDGSFESRTVDNVPVVKRTEIRTEAHVVEGESLLIGGITIESQANDSNGVPGISKVPVLGALVRQEGTRTTRSERLFLITPKLVRDIDRLPPPKGNEADPAVPGGPEGNSSPAPSSAPASAPSAAAPARVAASAPAAATSAPPSVPAPQPPREPIVP